jgi:hypothetical protein
VTGGGGGGSAIWGGIAGTLSNQTDLQTVLDSKLSSVTWGSITGTLSNQTDLQTVLDAKALKITAITAGTGLTGGGDLSQSRTISMLADVPADSLNFNTAATETAAIGKMFWNTTEGSPQVGLAGGNVQLIMGSMVVAYVRNGEATTLNKGEVVYLFGASGNRATVKRASNVGDPTSAKTMGIVAESIAANQVGFIVTQGVLDGLSLGSPYVAGDSIYLDTTPGAFTRVKPTQPDHIVFIGVVERANAGNGQIYIKPQNGFELEELHDVLITSPTNNQTILWNSATTLWVNSTLTVGTISGLSADLSGKVTSVTGTTPIVSSGGTTPTISIPVATATTSGYISSTDWSTFNSKAKTADVQVFTTSGTWTKPTGAKSINVQLFGGGAGGGSGRKDTTILTVKCGGGGGGGGGYLNVNIAADQLASTELVTIGGGGNGGSGVTVTSNGGGGSLGGSTSFNSVICVGGAGGNGGTSSAGQGGSGLLQANSGASASTTGAVGVAGNPATISVVMQVGGAGGGAGGGNTIGDIAASGGAGGRSNVGNLNGGTAGASNGGAGGTGVNNSTNIFYVGSGGGGGGGGIAVSGGSGGAGGFPAGGGGGGGATTSGGSSGAGGAGANGFAIITTYF